MEHIFLGNNMCLQDLETHIQHGFQKTCIADGSQSSRSGFTYNGSHFLAWVVILVWVPGGVGSLLGKRDFASTEKLQRGDVVGIELVFAAGFPRGSGSFAAAAARRAGGHG